MGYSYQKGFGWPQVIFALFLIFIVAGILFPLLQPRHQASPRREALNNAKAIASGLSAFKAEYGTYPSAETREVLLKRGYTTLSNRDDANAYLSQLLVSNHLDSETYFYAAGVKGVIKGDDIMDTPDTLLARGENSFAYIMTENRKPLNDVSSFTPLIIAPIKKTDENVPIFDGSPYADKYVCGSVDGSGRIGDIDKDTGHAKSKGRTNLLQTGPDSLFGSEIPVIKYTLGF